MTLEQIKALSDAEIDRIIAEKVMGLEVVGECIAWAPEGGGWTILPPNSEHEGIRRFVYVDICACGDISECPDLYAGWPERYQSELNTWGHYTTCLEVVPFYSSNANALREAELKLSGSQIVAYIKTLDYMLGLDCGRVDESYNDSWVLKTASPRLCAEAIVLAVMESEEK